MKKVLYPGSFDPITKGHMEVIKNAMEFSEVIICVSINNNKKTMFTLEERVEMIKNLFPKVKVIASTGATADIAEENGCIAILRGLRNTTDFEYEKTIAKVNYEINGIKTLSIFSNSEAVSSSIVKELFNLKKDISKYVDESIIKKMELKIPNS